MQIFNDFFMAKSFSDHFISYVYYLGYKISQQVKTCWAGVGEEWYVKPFHLQQFIMKHIETL